VFNEVLTARDSLIHRCDPRVRVLSATLLSLSIALIPSLPAQTLGLVVALSLGAAARLPLRDTLQRLMPLNVFLALLWVFTLASSSDMQSNAVLLLGITLRANAIVILITALVATLEVVSFGAALHGLRVSPKLVTLLLFTVRYAAVLRAEYTILRRAMRARCFAPRTNLHTLRALGNLVGMLLVRGFDRSERVLMAMKCRGYTGRFPHAAFRPMRGRDYLLASCALMCAATLFIIGRQ